MAARDASKAVYKCRLEQLRRELGVLGCIWKKHGMAAVKSSTREFVVLARVGPPPAFMKGVIGGHQHAPNSVTSYRETGALTEIGPRVRARRTR